MSDHYRTLEIQRNASQAEIKAAYRRLAKKYHPDKNRSEHAEQIFKEISKAHEVLSNPAKKATYDASLNTSIPGPGLRTAETRVYKSPTYSKSTLKKGRIFGFVLFLIVIILPLALLRFSSKYNYQKGLEYYSDGKLSQALQYLDKAIIEFGAKKIEASFKAVNICYENGYYSQGIAFAQKGNDYVADKYLKGNLYFLEGLGWEMMDQYQEADHNYKKALDYGYKADSVFIHLGMLHGFELEHYKESLKYFDHLIDSSGQRDYLLQRGIVYQKSGNFKNAIHDLQSFIEDNPDNGMGYFFLGISLIDDDQLAEACRILNIASDKGLSESDAYLRLYCKDLD